MGRASAPRRPGDTPVTPRWRPRARGDSAVVDVDGDAVVLDPDGLIHLLNPTAAAVWRLCDGAHDVADIVTELASRYRAPGETVEADVQRVLNEFCDIGLVA